MQHAWWFTRRALRLSGASATLLTPAKDLRALDRLDGVVLGGGSDIDPARYREEPAVETRYDSARDEFELRALEHAVGAGIPVLGICRGAQLLNVFLGGTLHQSLQEAVPGFRPRRMIFARKGIVIDEGTRLHDIMQTTNLRVNSLHKQGVSRLGDGLRVAARDDLGVVQAIEGDGGSHRFLVGVQWHPEYLLGSRSQRRLFRSLVRAASQPKSESSVTGGDEKEPADLPGRRSTPVERPRPTPAPVEPEREPPPPAESP